MVWAQFRIDQNCFKLRPNSICNRTSVWKCRFYNCSLVAAMHELYKISHSYRVFCSFWESPAGSSKNRGVAFNWIKCRPGLTEYGAVIGLGFAVVVFAPTGTFAVQRQPKTFATILITNKTHFSRRSSRCFAPKRRSPIPLFLFALSCHSRLFPCFFDWWSFESWLFGQSAN